MFDRRLLGKLWLAGMAGILPLMAVMSVKAVANDGLSWPTLAEIALEPFVLALVCFLFALYVYAALARRARGTGIPLTADALEATQEHALPADRAALLIPGLSASERAWDVVSGDELHFRWRPFRGRRSVTGTVTFDETSGEARLTVRADENVLTGPGLRRAGAFVALCQIARLVSR